MADTVASKTLMETKKRLVVRASIQSDGTGSTDAVLVDKSTFTGPNGLEPSKLVIEEIEWNGDGMQVILEFDHNTDDLICTLGGTNSNAGEYDFAEGSKYQGFVDPASTGGTGDIVATTVGHTAGDKMDMVLYLRKKD
jgi:hypothetical protein